MHRTTNREARTHSNNQVSIKHQPENIEEEIIRKEQ